MERQTRTALRVGGKRRIGDGFRGAKDFRDLEVWRWCRALRKDLEGFCQRLPQGEQYRLGDQTIRAARSVTANLAEGFGRYHYQDSIQMFRIARGSLFELLDHLVVATENRYLPEAQFKAYEERIESGLRLLNGYMRYLQNRKKNVRAERSANKPINQ